MNRRLFLSVTALGMVSVGLAHAQPVAAETEPTGKPRHTVSLDQMRRAVAQRFPLRYTVPGLLRMDLQAPSLRLLPVQNRLGAEMAVEAAGAVLERSHKGLFDVDFALRYEASDHTIRAHQLRIKRLQIPSLPANVVDMLNIYAPAMAEQSLLEVVLYQLRPQDLTVPDAMGMRPDRVTVTDQGVEIGFALKPL